MTAGKKHNATRSNSMTQPKENLNQYKRFGLSLLQLLGILFVVGIVAQVLVSHYF